VEIFARDPFVSRPGYTLIAAGWFCRVEVFHFNAFEVLTYVIYPQSQMAIPFFCKWKLNIGWEI